MIRLFIAEKKLAGESLADYLSKKNGLVPVKCKYHIEVGNDIVAWLSGHLLELFEPEEYDTRFSDRNNFANLPIIPKPFKLKISSRGAPLISNIKNLIKFSDSICHFGDPDREGQLIVDELLEFVGNTKPVTRLWTSALNNSGLETAFQLIKSNDHYKGYRDAALARSHADWLYGINMSRAVTISARERGASGFFSVGRVQTPTLAMVANRENEINNFVPQDYFKPWIEIISNPKFKAYWVCDNDSQVNSDGLLTDKSLAVNIVESANSSGIAEVVLYDVATRNENSPLPFSLSALQGHCSSLFAYSGSKTLEIAQSLYLLKIISYPRASSDYLPESQFSEAPLVLTSLAKVALPTSLVHGLRGSKFSIKSRAWDDVKSGSPGNHAIAPGHHAIAPGHHAIAPVALDNPVIIDGLSDEQRKVYFEIVKRFIMQFWAPATFLETVIDLKIKDNRFQAKGRRYTSEGWRKAFTLNEEISDNEKEENESEILLLPDLKVGQTVSLNNSNYDSHITKPPKRFTEGTLLMAMKNIHKYVVDPAAKSRLKESAGIGTEATRADIIKGLIDKELIEVRKKDLYPTEKGSKLIAILPKSMTTPDMTAMWESFMDMLLNGKSSYLVFISEQQKWLTQLISNTPSFFAGINFTRTPGAFNKASTSYICPNCKKSNLNEIESKGKKFFACDSCKSNFSWSAEAPIQKSESQKSSIVCPQCKKNNLQRRLRKDNSGAFWSCLGWKPDKTGCNKTFPDVNGEPNFSLSQSTKSQGFDALKTGNLNKFQGFGNPK